VPAHGIEYDQREIVEVIHSANLRGYSDFTGTPCAPPTNADLQQLRKALEGYLRALPNWYIDTNITFTVHGTGANFANLDDALWYLSKYVITNHGFVTLAIAAGLWTYNTRIDINHPNADRILITGANLISYPVSTDFAVTGYTVTLRANDRTNTLNRLRTRFATELAFTGTTGISNHAVGCTLQNLLITGDRTSGGGITGATLVQSAGLLYLNNVSIVNGVGNSGLAIQGGGVMQKDGSIFSSSGCTGHGIGVFMGGNHWHGNNTFTYCTSNDANGVGAGFNCGSNGYSTFIANGNGGAGVMCSIMGEYQVGGSSQFNTNAVNGVFVDQGLFYADNYPPGGAGGAPQFLNNGGAGGYVVVGSSFQAAYAVFSGNAGGPQLAVGAGSYAYVPSISLTGYSQPALNTMAFDGSYIST
jgi:hypothetical protein